VLGVGEVSETRMLGVGTMPLHTLRKTSLTCYDSVSARSLQQQPHNSSSTYDTGQREESVEESKQPGVGVCEEEGGREGEDVTCERADTAKSRTNRHDISLGLTASAARRRSRSRRLDRDTEGPAPNNNGGESNAASTGSVGGIDGIGVDEGPYRTPSTD